MWSVVKHAYDYVSAIFGPGGLNLSDVFKLTYIEMTTPCCMYPAKVVYDERGRYVHLAGCTQQTRLSALKHCLHCLRTGLDEVVRMHRAGFSLRSWDELLESRRPVKDEDLILRRYYSLLAAQRRGATV
jgi:hypothetical protein